MQAPISLKSKQTTILSSAVIITFVYWLIALWYNNQGPYSKNLVVFHQLFGHIFKHTWLDLYQYLYQFAATVLLFLVIPWLICKYVLHISFSNLVWRYAKNKTALLICAIVYPLVLVSTWFSSAQPVLQAEYPLSKLIGSSWCVFISYQIAYFFYFFAYESFFRGYLQFGMLSNKPTKTEITTVIIIQTVLTTLFHIGKPTTEIITAAVFGPVLGYVAIRFNSIWYGMVIHYLMNVLMDYFILYRLHLLPQ